MKEFLFDTMHLRTICWWEHIILFFLPMEHALSYDFGYGKIEENLYYYRYKVWRNKVYILKEEK